ncbi:MAG: GAF domain-containing protein [Lachnospiraceae bacterium]|nr:GAF domain-containing protein [Lachnospiraceae bacterium]
MKEYTLERLIDIAIALSAEKDINVLLDRILKEAMDITSCDGGTVYILNDGKLHFRNMITVSKGTHFGGPGEPLPSIPPIPLGRTHVCACAALDNRKINIADVYESGEFDFKGAKAFDESNDYRTCSMLVIPMNDEKDNPIGVLQLINAKDENGNTVPFKKAQENLISALASQAAVSLNNKRLLQTVQDILHSFVEVMVDAVDARTPYNANHTRHMVTYADRFLKWCRESGHDDLIDRDDEDAFLMSVWLHDIGKLVIPMEIMDKPTRLGSAESTIMNRITIGILMEKLKGYEDPKAASGAKEAVMKLEDAKELILSANSAGYLPDEKIEALKKLSQITCLTEKGEKIPLLDDKELTAITVQKGTLTSDERRVMESHVSFTTRMLQKMKFDGVYARVPEWAGNHHELLDGSGYPDHKNAEDLSTEVRLLTILDIYDALTADDRPYKPPMPVEKAFAILKDMAGEGKLDSSLLELFIESNAWDNNAHKG